MLPSTSPPISPWTYSWGGDHDVCRPGAGRPDRGRHPPRPQEGPPPCPRDDYPSACPSRRRSNAAGLVLRDEYADLAANIVPTDLHLDGTGHVDMFMKSVGTHTILMGQYDPDEGDSNLPTQGDKGNPVGTGGSG
jgi:hypothetical protein